ncbi:hypothetical protein PPL_03798 [Heterostelium album PN500]|uniref:Fcf2 pre-rRNA processing C-terminal domain-containing protein n=1 Tax=Heterostelium pallidum (strain ATCC 26659 / Pp 5 / PN500) TaxID=670386 RepID=D3B6P6_HETP5|nr:hypothetical protein PPL_03798 [Heterostelium album PN500]EFA83016.1 hypothetical protein PPL_03798 [Heterostelium album PN500]|eukprot:XP_020435133.1 hypothetical protein PPL_03798 [Heterostelium album PN500]
MSISLESYSLSENNSSDTDSKQENLAFDEFKLIDQLAKSAALHLGQLVNEQKLLSTQGVLKNELKKVTKKELKGASNERVLDAKNKIKTINESDSVLPNKVIKKPVHENKKWFGFGEGEITEEMKLEAELIRLKSFADNTKKRSKDATKELPKYFEVGTFINNHEDYYNRFTNREKKRGNLGDIMEDEKVMNYIDRKSSEIIAADQEKKKALRVRATKKKRH